MSDSLTVVGMGVHYHSPHAVCMYEVPPLHISPQIGISLILAFVYIKTKQKQLYNYPSSE